MSLKIRPKFRIPDELWRLAADQHGVITTAQTQAFGVTRKVIQRLLDEHVLWPVARGLYSCGPVPTWGGLAWGGVLLGREGAVLGAESAGYLHGLCPQPDTIDVLVPRRVRNRGPWRFRETRAEGIGTPPRTRIEDTALTLCSAAAPDDALAILASAVSSRRTTPERILARASSLPNLHHRALLVEILSDVAAGSHSALEARYRRDVELAHGLPSAVRQQSVSPGTRSDVLYDEWLIIVELDGQLGHTGEGRFRDFQRDNRHTLRGWITLRIGWRDVVTDPCGLAQQLETVLRRRGWLGSLRRCSKCPTSELSVAA